MIKLDLMALANAHTATQKQISKAEAYSARCNRVRKIQSVLKTIGGIIALAMFFLMAGFVGKLDCEAKESIETRTVSAVLVDIDDETGGYILQTEDGHQWRIIDPPEVLYEITFDTKGTVSVEDDEIIGLEEYNGDAEKAVEAVK